MNPHRSIQRVSTQQMPTSRLRAIAVRASPNRSLMLQRAREYYEGPWSNGRITLLDGLMADNHQHHDTIWQPQRTSEGLKAMKRGILAFRVAYPDLFFTVESLAAAEDEVFVAWEARGTNTGCIHDQPPSHLSVSMKGISRLKFNEETKISASFVFRQAPLEEMTAYSSANQQTEGVGQKSRAQP